MNERSGGHRGYSLTRRITVLLESPWENRWQLLGTDAELCHPAIAAFVRAEDPLLALAIERCCAQGVEIAQVQFGLAITLSSLVQDASSPDLPQVLQVLDDGVGVLIEGQVWLADLLEEALHALAPELRETSKFTQLVAAYFVAKYGVDVSALNAAADLVSKDWPDVWQALLTDERVIDLPAALCFEAVESLLNPDEQFTAWTRELTLLFEAASKRGSKQAISEHQMIIRAQDFMTKKHPDGEFISGACELAREMGEHWQRTGAKWVLSCVVQLTNYLDKHVQPDSEEHNDVKGLAASALMDAIYAGVRPSEEWHRAVSLAESALVETDLSDPSRAMRAFNCAIANSYGVAHGVLSAKHLLRAVALLDEAMSLCQEELDNYQRYLAYRGMTAIKCVQHGILDQDTLAEAYASAWESFELGRNHLGGTDGWYAQQVGNLITQAVGAGVLRPRGLLEAIDRLREGFDAAGYEDQRGDAAFNLGTAIGQAVEHGLLSSASLVEAVEYQRLAVRLSPSPEKWGNLSNRLFQAAEAYQERADWIREAVTSAREAVRLTASLPRHHPDRIRYVATLGNRLSELDRAGLASSQELLEAVQLQREAADETPEGHPLKWGYECNSASSLILAAQKGLSEPAELVIARKRVQDAVDALERAQHPLRSYGYANLSMLIHTGVVLGVFPDADLVDAVRYQRTVLQLWPKGNHAPKWTTSLTGRMSAAVAFNHLPAETLLEALDMQQEVLRRSDLRPTHERAESLEEFAKLIHQALGCGVVTKADAGERLQEATRMAWDMLRLSTPGHSHRIVALRRMKQFVRRVPAMLLRCLGPLDAIIAIEILRGHLSDTAFAPNLPNDIDVSRQLTERYVDAARAFNEAQRRDREGIGNSEERDERFKALNMILREIRAIDGLEGFAGAPRLDELVKHLPRNASLVYLISDDAGGTALVVNQNFSIEPVALPGLTEDALRDAVVRHLSGPGQVQSIAEFVWDAALRSITQVARASRLILVLTGETVFLPFQCAGKFDDAFADDFTAVQLIPSAAALARKHGPAAHSLSIVATAPTSDLPFARADVAVAERYLRSHPDIVDASEATIDATMAAISEAADLIFAGHGRFGVTEGSSLTCLDGTVQSEDVEQLPVMERGIAILNACETALTALEFPEEYIGLPSAFLRIGFSGVIATCWPVRDLIAFIFLLRLLQLKDSQPSSDFARLTRSVRTWMRTSTKLDLEGWIHQEAVATAFPEEVLRLIREWLGKFGPAFRPLEDPADWGAFVYTGC